MRWLWLFLAVNAYAADSSTSKDPFHLWKTSPCDPLAQLAPELPTPLPAAGDRYVALPMEIEPAPSTIIGVGEGKTATTRYVPGGRKTLATYELMSCVAVMIYDPVTKVGTVSHLYPGRYEEPWEQGRQGPNVALIAKYGAHVRAAFTRAGGDFSRAEVTFLWGTGGRKVFTPIVNAVVANFSDALPGKLSVDARAVSRPVRAVALDLSDGRVTELLPGAGDGRTWNSSKDFDTSKETAHPPG